MEEKMTRPNYFSHAVLCVLIAYSVTCPAVETEVHRNDSKIIGAIEKLPTVAIVTTGGTIAEKTDPKTGGAVPAVSGKSLVKAVPELLHYANIKVHNFSNIDSSQMNPAIWTKLSRKVDAILKDDRVKGVVVTHGTDTMAEAAYFLETTLISKKPVVFVGAMRDASDLSPDGPDNILNAVIQVCSPQGQNLGVTVTLNQYICSAAHVRKTNTTNVQTFNCGNYGYLGYICQERVYQYNDKPMGAKIPCADNLPVVPLLISYSGDDGAFIRHAVDIGAKGLVIEALGAGNVDAKAFEAVKYALSKGVVIVITSSVTHGGAYPIYGDAGGGTSLQRAGAILSPNIKGAKARLLLMLALANGKTRDEIKHYF